MNWLPRASLFVVLLGVLGGCSSKPTDTAQLAPVNGTVTLDGKAMDGGVIRFSIPGRPVKSLEIKNGSFEGKAYAGKNHVEVLWEKDGPPHDMDPNIRLKVNTISPAFSGPNSKLSADIEPSGSSDLKFAVTTK